MKPLETILHLSNRALPILAASSVILGFVPDPFGGSGGDAAAVVTDVALAGICTREILFYGLGYKVEVAAAVVCLVLAFVTDVGAGVAVGVPPAGIVSGGLALSLAVLSVGKVFEPVRSDLVPDRSAFFLEGNGVDDGSR